MIRVITRHRIFFSPYREGLVDKDELWQGAGDNHDRENIMACFIE
jgi:hypothetical protein